MQREAAMKRCLHILASALLAAVFVACDADKIDHKPPEGKGSIVVDNNTARRFNLFVDGIDQGRIGSFKDRSFDFDPGVYRIVLDEDDGNLGYADEIDVLEGHLTVLDLGLRGLDGRLDVSVFLDD